MSRIGLIAGNGRFPFLVLQGARSLGHDVTVVAVKEEAFADLEPAARWHLAHLYGSLAEDVLAGAEDDPALLRPLHPDAPDVAAQAVYARRREWAVTAEDVLRRRTTLALRGLGDTLLPPTADLGHDETASRA